MVTAFYRRFARWQRCRALRPARLTTREFLASMAYCAALGGIVLVSLYAITLRATLLATAYERDALQQQYDHLMTAHLICLNGGAPYRNEEALPSGQVVTVFTVCDKAKEKVYQ